MLMIVFGLFVLYSIEVGLCSMLMLLIMYGLMC